MIIMTISCSCIVFALNFFLLTHPQIKLAGPKLQIKSCRKDQNLNFAVDWISKNRKVREFYLGNSWTCIA